MSMLTILLWSVISAGGGALVGFVIGRLFPLSDDGDKN